MKRVLASVCLALIATSAMAASKTTTTKAATPKSMWTTTGTIANVSGKGLSAETIKTIKSQTISSKTCMSSKPTNAEIQAAISSAYGQCKFQNFSIANNMIRTAMTCTGAYGPMTSNFAGARGANTFTGSNTAAFTGDTGNIVVISVINGKITGSC